MSAARWRPRASWMALGLTALAYLLLRVIATLDSSSSGLIEPDGNVALGTLVIVGSLLVLRLVIIFLIGPIALASIALDVASWIGRRAGL